MGAKVRSFRQCGSKAKVSLVSTADISAKPIATVSVLIVLILKLGGGMALHTSAVPRK